MLQVYAGIDALNEFTWGCCYVLYNAQLSHAQSGNTLILAIVKVRLDTANNPADFVSLSMLS